MTGLYVSVTYGPVFKRNEALLGGYAMEANENKKKKGKVRGFFAAIGGFFGDFGTAVKKGDIFTKLSLIVMGAGNAARKQWGRAVLITIIQVAVILMSVMWAPQYVSKFSTLGTVQKADQKQVFDMATMKFVTDDSQPYDHSFKILLYCIMIFVVWFVFFIIWMKNEISAYKTEQLAKSGGRVPKIKDDIKSFANEKFHITLLSLPVTGIVVFTIVPILLLILVAFTNYDQNHMTPTYLFTWVGFDNFASLFGSGGLTSSFSYAFVRILGWTLIWAFFATLTNFVFGIMLALLVNNKRTKIKPFWRTLFVITIAVPQFVSLLLVKNFFADSGIVNTILSDWGVTGLLNKWGLIKTNFIPFLSKPGWAHVMIILINIWIGIPYTMMVTTGVLLNLPSDQLESARIDGARSGQIFRKITMPYIMFIMGPTLVTDFVKNINNFNVIYLLTEGNYATTNQLLANSQAKETDLLVTWLFRLTQDYYNYKMASVIGIMVFLVCVVFTLIAFNRFIKGDREETFQ